MSRRKKFGHKGASKKATRHLASRKGHRKHKGAAMHLGGHKGTKRKGSRKSKRASKRKAHR